MKKLLCLCTVVVYGLLSAQTICPIVAYTNTTPGWYYPPDYWFLQYPTALTLNWYDYLPGGTNSSPVRVFNTYDDFTYITYCSQETEFDLPRVFYSCIDSGGNVVTTSVISGPMSKPEKHGSIAIDQISGDPFVAWDASDPSGPDARACMLSYDLFHLMGGPGLWKSPFSVVNHTTPSQFVDDLFQHPTLCIGPSPTLGKQRLYMSTTNTKAHTDDNRLAENILLAYADFDANDLAAQSQLNWAFSQIDVLDGWNAGIPHFVQPHLALTVSQQSGTLAYVGYDNEHRLLAFVNDSYGVGEWDFYRTKPLNVLTHFQLDNPQNLDGSAFFDIAANAQLYWAPINCTHFNAQIVENNSMVFWPGCLGLQSNDLQNSYFPYYTFPKLFGFDLISHSFSIIDLDTRGQHPFDEYPAVPWDLDEDGTVDGYDANGLVAAKKSWPFYYHDEAVAQQDNLFSLTLSEEGDYLFITWQDGLKAKLAEDGDPAWAGWEETAEIAMAGLYCMPGHSTYLSETARLNANNTPQLAGMKPCYVYPVDRMIDTGYYSEKMGILFLDDPEYGSHVLGCGPAAAGTHYYMQLSMSFYPYVGTSNHTVPAVSGSLQQNFPNPFNPSTAMSFNLKEAAQASVEVYNNKGQKVRTVADGAFPANTSTVSWNGTDDNGQAVSSGIYFYQLKVNGTLQDTRKCVLMK